MLVLKIIGIVLGSILGLILLLILWILFSPIRYSGFFRFHEKPYVKVKFSYLLWIIHGFFVLDESGKRYDAKALWISLLHKKDKKSTKKRKKKALTANNTNKEVDRTKIINKTVDDFDDFVPQSDTKQITTSKPIENNKKPKKSIFKKVIDKYNSIRKSISNINKKRERIISEINNKNNQEAVRFGLVLLKDLLKHILPRKHKISIKFGSGDPATTGEILGAIYAISALLSLNIYVEPDFDNKIFECDIPFKGRISIFYILVLVIKAYRNKKFMALVNKIRG